MGMGRFSGIHAYSGVSDPAGRGVMARKEGEYGLMGCAHRPGHRRPILLVGRRGAWMDVYHAGRIFLVCFLFLVSVLGWTGLGGLSGRFEPGFFPFFCDFLGGLGVRLCSRRLGLFCFLISSSGTCSKGFFLPSNCPVHVSFPGHFSGWRGVAGCLRSILSCLKVPWC